jgi:hypothetical protein
MKMKFVFCFSLSPCFISAPSSETRNWLWQTLFLFRFHSLVLEIFFFHSFAMINSYRRSFNINFALYFLSFLLSLSIFDDRNWKSTGPLHSATQPNRTRSVSCTSWLYFILCHSYYAPNVCCAWVFFLQWRVPFLSESFLIWLFICLFPCCDWEYLSFFFFFLPFFLCVLSTASPSKTYTLSLQCKALAKFVL